MRRLLISLLVIMMTMAIGGVAFADDPHGSGDATATATATGGSATGGSATIQPGAIVNTQVGGTFAPTFSPTNQQGQSLTNTNTVKGGDVNVGNGIGNFSPSAKATIEKGAVDIDNKNTNVNVNKNTNTQGQKQGQSQGQKQGQGQFQGQNNDQVISPSQSITFEAPDLSKQRVIVGTAPNAIGNSELNFISPNERDVQTILPKFGCGVVKPLLADDCIVDVIWQSNDIKFKDLYKEILKGLRSDEVKKMSAKSVRYQIREAASAKTWTTGGSLSGAGVGNVASGVGSATGSIVPQVGRSKSSNLYTIIYVQVQEFKN